MKVIQISVAPFDGGTDVFGLGDDGNVYYWNNGEWKLDVSPPKQAQSPLSHI